MDATDSETEQLLQDRPDSPGVILRHAREQRGMSIGDVAEVTRVAQRQLEAIERSDFGALPGAPYAVGFARAYARAVGADEVAVARGVREELGLMETSQRHEMFEPVDPARVPPRRLAWVAAGIALMLAIIYAVWRTQFFAASTDQEIADLANRASVPAAVAPGPVAGPVQQEPAGPVVLTAQTAVWVRVYDQAGERLFEKEMAKGESYTVPLQANNPMILTGRPDALAVTVGGKPVAPLGPPEKTIVDVPISASALLARPAMPAPATQAGGGTAQSARPAPVSAAPSVPAPAPVAVQAAAPAPDGAAAGSVSAPPVD